MEIANTDTAAASVWARPIDDGARDQLAVQKANAAIGLLHLGQEDELWPLLRNSSDPRLRAILIDSLAQYSCSAETLLKRLDSESDVAVRRALLLSLSGFEANATESAQLNEVVSQLRKLYLADSDPGVHSATDLLLRRWGHAELLSALNNELHNELHNEVNGQYQLHSVASLRPNDFGLFDTLGNVMEWCQDASSDYPQLSSDSPVDQCSAQTRN